MQTVIKSSWATILVLVLGACAGVRAGSQAGVSAPTESTVSVSEPVRTQPANVKAADQSTHYLLQPGDKLIVNVYPDKEFTREVIVDESGLVHLPLVGTLHWAGKTVSESMAELESLLRGTYYLDPKVVVSVSDFRSSSERVYVFGQVKNPGAYNYRQGVTLLRAIALAGGFTDVARDQSVEILRKRASAKQNEERERVDINDIIRAKIPDPVLEPDDVVVVPESFF